MRIALLVTALLIHGANARAELADAAVLPDAVLQSIEDDDVVRLPRQLSSQERLIWRLPAPLRLALAPPPAPVRAPAEYEANDGLLMRWGSFNSVITEITVAVTSSGPFQGGPAPFVYLVVSSASQQTSASQTLSTAGADMNRVQFIIAQSNSVWMRDYGPRVVNSSGLRGFIDHTYNRPRPLDDAIPSAVAPTFASPVYALPLTHGGGNFHLFDDGEAFMTQLIVNENPGVSADQIKAYYRDYQGLDLTLTGAFPTSFDSTQHIDMWMLPVARKKVLISEYPDTGGVYTEPRQVTETTAQLMRDRGYEVLRIPGWRGSNGAHYTYANAVVMNNKVLICRFTGEDARNAQALSAYQAAFPARQVVTIDCSSIITSAGAIHCIVMHISTAILLYSGFED